MNNVLKSIFISGVLATSTIMASATPKADIKDLPTEELIKQNKQIVGMAAEEISKTLPKKVDKYTVLVSVKAQGTTLAYSFTIDTGSKSDKAVIKEDRERMQKAITAGVCRTSMRFLNAKVSLKYQYSSATSKKKLFSFTITEKDCPERLYK